MENWKPGSLTIPEQDTCLHESQYRRNAAEAIPHGKIHRRHGYRWVSVHEFEHTAVRILKNSIGTGMVLNHYPDSSKQDSICLCWSSPPKAERDKQDGILAGQRIYIQRYV